ncbi:MAG: YwiC-like family protein [Candidatus Omnitrophica bacterium]|nr:YwiC-like family protein [Candidatus Omnitrophota bacterium]MDE2213598.1 YwiC-like family protein [Candidatus Omnitrophota bacterium]MDE2230501.1 YwiC-like family protein [Candidatus Omnitrophota bacterium]
MRHVDASIIKKVILPAEHGASIMLAESLMAGLWIGASFKGFVCALGWIFIFFMSQPLKIAVKDDSRNIFAPRTEAALWCATVMGILAILAVFWTYFLSGPSFLMALAAVMPLGAVHLWTTIFEGKKEFAAELFGVLSLGAAAASIVLASGHQVSQAFVLWLVLAIRAGASVVYVRYRLRQMRNESTNFSMVVIVHILGLIMICGLVLFHIVKPVVILAGLLLIVRLSFRYRNTISAQVLGIHESLMGLFYVVLVILGV